MEGQELKQLESIQPSHDFLTLVQQASHEPISRCYQCQKCSGGCPMYFAMDLKTHEIIRSVQLGRKDRVLQSDSLWNCVACRTCKARCPNGIDTSKVVDALKSMAMTEGSASKDNKVATFHDSFLSSVNMFGKVYEAGMMGMYKVKTKNFTDDLRLGLELFRRGKLKILPDRVRNMREIKAIFRKAKEKSR